MSKLNLKMRKVIPVLLVLILMAAPMSTVAYAAENSSGAEGPQSWLDRAKEALPDVIDKAKDVASDAKEGLQNAQNSLSEWNQGQQDQFWQRIDDQLGTNASNGSAADDASTNVVHAMPPAEPETPPTKDSSSVEDSYTSSGIYYYNPDQPTGDGTDRTPNASVETFEKGNGYVVVDGERYELTDDSAAEDSTTEPEPTGYWSKLWNLFLRDINTRTELMVNMLPLMLVLAIIIVAAYCWRNRRK